MRVPRAPRLGGGAGAEAGTGPGAAGLTTSAVAMLLGQTGEKECDKSTRRGLCGC